MQSIDTHAKRKCKRPARNHQFKLPVFILALFTALIATSNGLADIVTSTATARIGSSETAVVATQTNAFNPLMTESSGANGGVALFSAVNATFTSADQYQVDMTSNWDFRNVAQGGTMGFGSTFDYQFVADGSVITVVASGIALSPLFSGASTFGGQDFHVRLFNLTTPGGLNLRQFGGDGTATFSTTAGSEYLLQIRETSSVSAGGGSSNLGMLHTGTFDVTVPAKFNAVPEPGTAGLLFLTFTTLVCRRRRN